MSKSILVIDGDRSFASRMSTALQSRGLETRICADGPQGLDEARARRPDLILLCVELPTMSGYAVCNKIKKDEQLRSVPLVLTSSEATAETFEQHRRLRTRAEEYLLKPFDGAALLQRIESLIELPPRATAPQERAFGDDDLELIDRAFDELASSGGVGTGTASTASALTTPAVVGRVEPGAARPSGAAIELERLRTRVSELEAELARAADALRESTESSRTAVERANAAETRATAAEARIRHGDALREKARRALSVVLQALDEGASQRQPPGEVSPRRE